MHAGMAAGHVRLPANYCAPQRPTKKAGTSLILTILRYSKRTRACKPKLQLTCHLEGAADLQQRLQPAAMHWHFPCLPYEAVALLLIKDAGLVDMPSTMPHLQCRALPEVQHRSAQVHHCQCGPIAEAAGAQPAILHCIARELIQGQCYITASHLSKTKLACLQRWTLTAQ